MISFNYKILGAVLDTGLSGVVVGATQRENKRETETRQTEEATAVFTSITVMGSSSRIRIQEHNPIAVSQICCGLLHRGIESRSQAKSPAQI